jgi:ABC-type multidrug transport system ATPase subunit
MKIDNLVKFENFTLTINPGDRFSFLGTNGGGKTTLLELIIQGLTTELTKNVFEGKLEVHGEIIDWNGNNILYDRTDDLNKQIAYVSQKNDFSKNSTVLSEAELSLFPYQKDLDEAYLDQLLEKFGLKKNIKKSMTKDLSGGESRIISIILALLRLDKVKILILDEPLNHLSFKNSKILNELLLTKMGENKDLSILMVSHCRALSFVDRSIIFDQNKNTFVLAPYKSYDCFDSFTG